MPRVDEIDRRTDVVFIIFHFGEIIHGVTKVQKLLFLVEQETTFFEAYESAVAFNFAPYKMGPFSEDVYGELHFLLQMNAIEARPMSASFTMDVEDSELANKTFEITSKGRKIASQLVEILESEYRNELQALVTEYNELPLDDLLRYVYTEYPTYATKSEISNELFERCN